MQVSECTGRSDGAFGVGVADGVNRWVGGVAWPTGAHAVWLLTEQRGRLSGPAVGARRRRGLLGPEATRRRTPRRLRGLGEGGVTQRGSGLGQGLARSAAGGGGVAQNGTTARRRRLNVGRLALGGRRSKQQGGACHRWRHRGEKGRRVQAGVTSVWRLWRAVEPGRQETVLVVSTGYLRTTKYTFQIFVYVCFLIYVGKVSLLINHQINGDEELNFSTPENQKSQRFIL